MSRVLSILLVAAIVTFAAPNPIQAADYPSRPVRVLIGFPAGGSSDVLVRIVAQWLSARLGQPFVVENRPGAGTNVATSVAVNSPADGYTLLTITSTSAVSASLYQNLDFNFARDITPVAVFFHVPIVVVVNPSVPAKTIPEFITYVKANPGKIALGTPGVGTPAHLGSELFKEQTGLDMIHVPFHNDTSGLTELISGRIQVMFTGLPTSLSYIKSGQLRALAVATPKRLPELPDTPAISEFLPGFEVGYWIGIGASRGTPRPIIDVIHKEINAAIEDPTVKERLSRTGGEVAEPISQEAFQKIVKDDVEKWRKVIQTAHIQAH